MENLHEARKKAIAAHKKAIAALSNALSEARAEFHDLHDEKANKLIITVFICHPSAISALI